MKMRTPTSIIRSMAIVLGVPKNAVAATSVTTSPVTWRMRPIQYRAVLTAGATPPARTSG